MKVSRYHIEITRRAKEDIINTGDYIAYTLLEPQTTPNFVKGLRKAISFLHDFPQRYPLVDDPILFLHVCCTKDILFIIRLWRFFVCRS